MCQCRFIHYNACTTLMVNVDNGGGYALRGAGNEKSLYLPLSFGVNLKLLKKKLNLLKHYLK